MNTPLYAIIPNACAAQLPVKITINGRFLTQSVTGVQRYAIELIRALDSLLASGEIDSARYAVQIIAPPGARDLGVRHILVRHAGVLRGHLWEQLELPWLARNSLLVNLCNTAPIAKVNQVVTIHDAAVRAVPEAYSRMFRAWYRLLLPCIARMSKRVLTVSQFSKSELVGWLPLSEQKCVVISEGKEHIESVKSDNGVLTRFGLTEKPFVLAVSSLSPNKNFRAIVEALQWLGDAQFDLVIAGGTNPRIFAGNAQSLPNFVKHVGYVSDGELKALYEHASCFVYPSLYEGFGLPPLEAMACGCPVIVSNRASLPEVCGDAALYCDARDPRSIADQIVRLMGDSELRANLRQRGLERASGFSWKRCARETWDAITSG
ncbi:MAG: glycosyltransferase family 1 protein [Pseudomonadota bacterium]